MDEAGIEEVVRTPARQHAPHAVGKRPKDLLVPALRQAHGVRRADHARIPVEAVLHLRWFGGKDVKGGPGETP